MKNSFVYLLIAVLILSVSCGGDDKAKLEKLKAEYEKVGGQIQDLENKLGEDTTLMKTGGILVSTLKAVKDTFKTYIEIQGQVDGEENVMATSKAMGVVTQIYVKEGDQVHKGQILAQLDASVLEQTMKELKMSYEFMNDIYERQKSLWDQKIGSEVQYLSAKNNKESLELKIKTLNEQLDMYQITSPINGSVEEIPIKVGQNMAPGLVAFRVVNFSRVKVVADISEVYSGTIRKGDKVLIHFSTENIDYVGTLSFASRYINTINRTFRVETYINPKLLEFRANMIAVLKILNYSNPSVFSIPSNIILMDRDEPYIYKAVKNGKSFIVEKSLIKTGRTYNGRIEVLSGIEDGDIILTSNLYSVQPGEAINL